MLQRFPEVDLKGAKSLHEQERDHKQSGHHAVAQRAEDGSTPGSLVIWDVDGQTSSPSAAAAVQQATSIKARAESTSPRVILRLSRLRASDASLIAPSSCIELMLPGKLSDGGDDVWLRAQPVSCNDAARFAWRLSEPCDVTPFFCRLAMAEGSFLDSLAVVAMSVAAPKGLVGHQKPMSSVVYQPAASHADLVPGVLGQCCIDMARMKACSPTAHGMCLSLILQEGEK